MSLQPYCVLYESLNPQNMNFRFLHPKDSVLCVLMSFLVKCLTRRSVVDTKSIYLHILLYDIKYSNNLSYAFACLKKISSWGLSSLIVLIAAYLTILTQTLLITDLSKAWTSHRKHNIMVVMLKLCDWDIVCLYPNFSFYFCWLFLDIQNHKHFVHLWRSSLWWKHKLNCEV